MSYEVNKTNLLFEHLTTEEADQLQGLCERLVLQGKVEAGHPAFQAWVEVAGLKEPNQLLAYATAFPQRALLSIVHHWTGRVT